jgi:hypothetical protein
VISAVESVLSNRADHVAAHPLDFAIAGRYNHHGHDL